MKFLKNQYVMFISHVKSNYSLNNDNYPIEFLEFLPFIRL